MDIKNYNNELAIRLVKTGLSVFFFGLGANIVGMFSVDNLNDYIMGNGLLFALLSLAGAAVAFIGTIVEKKSNEKSV